MKGNVATTVGTTVAGAARYEFRMQTRRKALWITVLLFGLLVFTGMTNPWNVPARDVVVNWASVIQSLMPIAIGCLLADRLPRDKRFGVDELLGTLPGSPGGRLIGKYLGATFATLVPILLIYTAGILYTVADRGAPEAVPLALAMFAAVNMPGILFVAAFSVSCLALLWVPLYQFLFVGYWFWGNFLPPDGAIPTLSGTMLTPVGGYASAGFFGLDDPWSGPVAAWEGAASIALMLSLGALALLCAHRYLLWQKARQ